MNVNETVQSLLEAYGDGSDGTSPTQTQWQRILERDADSGFNLVNFFKFHETADYGADTEPEISGREAFQRYADVSVPTMQNAGGDFLAVAAFAGSLIGQEQDWDLIVVGKFPNLAAYLSLNTNPDYVRAFRHRNAAVARQFVVAMEQ